MYADLLGISFRLHKEGNNWTGIFRYGSDEHELLITASTGIVTGPADSPFKLNVPSRQLDHWKKTLFTENVGSEHAPHLRPHFVVVVAYDSLPYDLMKKVWGASTSQATNIVQLGLLNLVRQRCPGVPCSVRVPWISGYFGM
jgi:hypothetical protein